MTEAGNAPAPEELNLHVGASSPLLLFVEDESPTYEMVLPIFRTGLSPQFAEPCANCPLEISSQTCPEACFTDFLGVSQSC